MSETLTVVTLNTWKGDGAYWRRLPLMARAVAGARPDVVFLQEVLWAPDAGGADTSAVIAGATGLTAYDERAREGWREVEGQRVRSWSGLTLLSRWPARTARLDLPVSEGADWDRLAQVAEVETPLGPLTLVNLHLTHPVGETRMRDREMAVILEYLAGRSAGPVLLGGDFNDEPASPALRRPFEDGRWVCTNAVQAAATHGFATFSGMGFDAGRSIDHILLLESAGCARLRFLDAGPFGDWREDGVAPSDHVGVRAVLGRRSERSDDAVRG